MKTFTSVAPPASDLATLDFAIQWWTMPLDGSDPESGQETFTARRVVPPGVVIDLARATTLNDHGERIYDIGAIDSIMRGLMLDESYARYSRLVHDTARRVTIEQLGELAMWLAEELAGRPTGQPST
jgi:hypothetical protein